MSRERPPVVAGQRRSKRRRSTTTSWLDLVRNVPGMQDKFSTAAVLPTSQPSPANGERLLTTTMAGLPTAHTSPTNDDPSHTQTPCIHYGSDEEYRAFDMPYDDLEEEVLLSTSDASTAVDTSLISYIRTVSRTALSAANLMGVAAVTGSVKFTVKEYERSQILARWSGQDRKLPAYSTVYRTILPHLLGSSFPRSELVWLPRRQKELTPQSSYDREQTGCPERRNVAAARIIHPIEWALLDIATLPFYKDIYCGGIWEMENDAAGPPKNSIELSKIVQDRNAILNATDRVYVTHGGLRTAATLGDCISVPFTNEMNPEILDQGTTQEMYKVIKCNRNETSFELHAVVSAVWCVGAPGYPTSSSQHAASLSHPEESEVIRYFGVDQLTPSSAEGWGNVPTAKRRRLRGAMPLHQDGVVAGDICVLLRPQTDRREYRLFCVLVCRFWKRLEGIPSYTLMWTRKRPGAQESPCHFEVILTSSVERCPALLEKSPCPTETPMRPNKLCAKNAGTLQDGRPYVVYRFLLYCDGFSPSSSLYKQRSTGGVYILPVGLSPECRTSRASVRVVSLTPPGVSTNEVILRLIPQIAKSMTHGVETYTATGVRVVVFLDMVGFVADYPAAAEAIDVIGPSGNAPCTHCSLRKFSHPSASNFGYTTNIHAQDSASLRCAERHSAVRNAGISDEAAMRLGMKRKSDSGDVNCPLLLLQETLKNIRPDIPLNKDGVPVVFGLFDAYRSNIVAPDHLLTGITKNILDLCFSLVERRKRKLVDTKICTAMKENGLTTENSIYNLASSKLHAMTLSSVYCVLCVSTFILPPYLDDPSHQDALHLLRDLQQLIALTFWNPKVTCDGNSADTYVHGAGGRQYMEDMQRRANAMVEDMNKCWSLYGERGKVMDKPNLHRLVELYEHTLPAFGHISHVMELVLEAAHQPLKKCLSQSNNRMAEASAVQHILADDWQSRLAVLSHFRESRNQELSELAKRGMRRLLLGRRVDELRSDVAEHGAILGQVDATIDKILDKHVLRMLADGGKMNAAWTGVKPRWKAFKAGPLNIPVSSWNVQGLVQRGGALFATFVQHLNDDGRQVTRAWEARRIRPTNISCSSSTRGYNRLSIGTVVQALVPRGREKHTVVRPVAASNSDIFFYIVIGVLETEREGTWAVVLRTPRNACGRITTTPTVHVKEVQLILLNDGVRRVGCYHDCANHGGCTVNAESKQVAHSESILSGGTFVVQSRKEGYPPRMG